MKRLLYPFSGCSAVFFPVGLPKDGGTCEFATKQCLKECAAFKNATKTNKIPYDRKEQIYEDITRFPIFDVCRQISLQLSVTKKILYWFASGDCRKQHTKRIARIIRYMSDDVHIQIGFTRNIELWKKVKDLPYVTFVLTVKSKKDITKGGLFAIPNFDTGQVTIIRNEWVVKKPKWEYSCPSIYGSASRNRNTTYWHKETILQEANCQMCFDEKKGCFTE